MVASIQDGLQLQAYQWRVKWDHSWGNWALKILAVEEGVKVGSKSLCRGMHQGMGWAQEAPKVSWALLQQVGQLGTGSMVCIVAGLLESSVDSQSWVGMAAMLLGGIAAMLPGGMAAMRLGGSPGSMLGYLAGIIKPGRVVLTVLVGAVGAWGLSEAYLMTGI